MPSCRILLAAVAVLSIGFVVRSSSARVHEPDIRVTRAQERVARGAPPCLPVGFERNDGQADARVRYLTRADGYALFLLDDEAVVVPAGTRHALRIGMTGARDRSSPRAGTRLPGQLHHLRGRDATRWVRHVPHFADVHYPDVLPGTDQVWSVSDGRAEFSFVARPGSRPDAIRLEFAGCDSLRIERGRLVADLPSGAVVLSPPRAYQGEDADRTDVRVRYALDGPDSVRFALDAHDPSRTLVIDPEIEYSTLYGGSDSDACNDVAVDGAGNCYVTGGTYSSDLPTTPGAFAPEYGDSAEDAFVAKLAPDGASLIYATYVGGSDDGGDEEAGNAIDVDASGRAHVAGITSSDDFPVVAPTQASRAGGEDAFVLTLSPDGSNLLFSTYLGGTSSDPARAIAVDAGGSIYVAGNTGSDDFPVQAPFQATRSGFGGDAYVVRIRDGAVRFATFLGGTNHETLFDLAVDRSNTDPAGTEVVVCGTTPSSDFPTANAMQPTRAGASFGSDAFVTRFAADGGSLSWSTYLGGSDFDEARAITVDTAGDVFVTGRSGSADFPVTAGFQQSPASSVDVFVSKLSSTGTLSYSTFLGGDAGEAGEGIAVTASGEAWIVGTTSSTDFPLVEPVQSQRQGNPDLFVSRLDASAEALLFSTYLGEAGGIVSSSRIAVAADGAVHVAGGAFSGYPTTAGALIASLAQGDFSTGFVTKFAAPGNEPPPNTIRSFILPKNLKVTVDSPGRRSSKPGVVLKAFFDSGPTNVDLADPARLTLGPKTFDIPALTPDKRRRSFSYKGEGLSLKIRPSPIGSSKGTLTVKYSGDLGPGVDTEGAFAMRFENDSGIDAKGECVLSGGSFTFGREAGELIAPELSIRKAKAKLPGVGRHNFKFVAGFTTQGQSPTTAPDLHIGFGEVFTADIPSSKLVLKRSNFRLTGGVAGIDAFTLTYAKERISVRGGKVDLGDVQNGPVPVLLIFSQDADVRAVFVRMVRKGKSLKY